MIENRDSTTSLLDRAGFLAQLGSQVTHCNEHDQTLALVVVDINGFTQINVGHGYEIGDAVLRHVARQLASVARGQDLTARIGDNRFALLLNGILNHGHVALAVQKLQRLLGMPFTHDEIRIVIGVSAGAAICPEHARQGERLLRKAETALVAARRKKEGYCMAAAVVGKFDLSHQWQLEMALDDAIERDELQLCFQPTVRLADRSVVGAEALIRWHSRDHGIVLPDVFIPLAERNGQIRKITIWALNAALRQARDWGDGEGSYAVAVNVPSQMAARRDLPDLVETALSLWGSERIRLVLEITERSLMDRSHTRDILEQTRRLGVDISIDDFGTGYSCLAYFKNIPADELKIDQSFVQDMIHDSASEEITNVIIDLAHRFNLRVVAEGIENQQTLDRLNARQCDLGQGFLFGKAMTPEAFCTWLRNHSSAS